MGVRIDKRRRQTNGALALTERQRTIALMVSSGKTNAEIAAALFITKRTVEHHIDHIRNRLGVRSRVEIIRSSPPLQMALLSGLTRYPADDLAPTPRTSRSPLQITGPFYRIPLTIASIEMAAKRRAQARHHVIAFVSAITDGRRYRCW